LDGSSPLPRGKRIERFRVVPTQQISRLLLRWSRTAKVRGDSGDLIHALQMRFLSEPRHGRSPDCGLPHARQPRPPLPNHQKKIHGMRTTTNGISYEPLPESHEAQKITCSCGGSPSCKECAGQGEYFYYRYIRNLWTDGEWAGNEEYESDLG